MNERSPMPRWTPDEVELLRRCYPTHSTKEVVELLGRSPRAVASKAQMLGLRKTPDRLSAACAHAVSHRWDRA